MEKLDGKSMDIVAQNIEKLKEIFPDVFTEGKVDFEALEATLGEYIERDDERYSFNWKGKARARRIAQTPSTGTLRPAPEESKNWESTQNLYIEGDNLEVLKLLQKSYHKQVKMIYIDPPYNTGKDFVYKDNFKDNLKNYLELTGQVDSEGRKLSTNAETSGRYHSDWLNMMYPRLKLARNLLKDDGVIFISIDDNEVANLRKVCDEIFGEDNFISEFPRITKKAGKTTDLVAKNTDYILSYGKSGDSSLNKEEVDSEGYTLSDEFEATRGKYKLTQTLDYGSIQYSPSLDYEIVLDGNIFRPGNVDEEEMLERQKRNPSSDFCWRWSKDLFDFGLKNGFIVIKESRNGKRIYTKTYEKAIISKDSDGYYIESKDREKPISTLEFIKNEYSNDNSRKDMAKLFDSKVFEYSKPVTLLEKIIKIGTKKDDIVLDFFSGSATTAHSVMQLNAEDMGNRQYIMVQLPEMTEENSEAFRSGYVNICEIGKERIRRAGEKIKEENAEKEGIENLDIGFKVFKLDSSNIKAWDPNSIKLKNILDYKQDGMIDYKKYTKILRESGEFNVDNMEDNEIVTKVLEYYLEEHIENIKPDRTEADLLYEILLKYGLDLTLPIEELSLADKKVYVVGLGSLVICLDKEITLETVEEIAKLKEKYGADDLMRVVFRDNGFKDAEVKTNAIQILKQFGIDDVKSL